MARLIGLKFNSRQGERWLRKLGTRGPQAIARALNRSGGTTRTAMVRAVSKDMNLPVGTVKEATRIYEATPNKLTVAVEAKGAPIPLMAWKPRTAYPSRGRGKGVTVRLPAPGKGRYEKAFIAHMRSGHVGVFVRKGKARLGIRELHGPSIAKVFEKHRPDGVFAGQIALIKNLRHELKFALQQSAQGS